jgi:hypothetical protein
MEEKQLDSLRQEIGVYQKLKELKNTKEFGDYMEFLTRTTASQMVNVFVSKNVTDWEEFCVARGEVLAKMHILQEIGGADLIVSQLTEQLKGFMNPQA